MKALPLLIILSLSPFAQADDWPWWRGPDRNGIAAADQDLPITFSETENVRWVADIPGRGHGSVIVTGHRVILATANEDQEVQSVLCYHKDTGKPLWRTKLHTGNFPKTNKKASHASSTPACDGERIYISFVNDGAAMTTALDLDGKQVWQTRLTDYVVHQGYGSSPAIYKDLVIVSADTKAKGGGIVCGLDRRTGKIVWKQKRPELPNYPSPIIHTIDGKDQLFLTGCELVSSFDPQTGRKLWEIEGATTECVTSTVTDGTHIYTSGGYPKNHVSAVLADGSGKVVWENTSRVYVPSMLVKNGHLYAVMDAGVAVCWNAATGERLWRERLGKRGFSSSPVMTGDLIYAGSEAGIFYVYKATPQGCEILAENQLGDEVFATPVLCGGRIYARVAKQVGDVRQEKLFCLEKKS